MFVKHHKPKYPIMFANEWGVDVLYVSFQSGMLITARF